MMTGARSVGLALALAALSLPVSAAAPASSESAAAARRAALAEVRQRFLSTVDRSEDPDADAKLRLDEDEELSTLRSQTEFLRAGRVEGFDDWPTYADMVVYVAGRLGVRPPEVALARYRGRVRPAGLPLTAEEARARSGLLGAISEPDFVKRYLVPHIRPDVAGERALFPNREDLARLEMLRDLEPKQRRLMSRLWTEIKVR